MIIKRNNKWMWPALALVLALSMQARAAVIGYEVTSSPQQARLHYDGVSILQALEPTYVDLSVNIDNVIHNYVQANFHFNATLASSSTVNLPGGKGTVKTLVFNGTFSFTAGPDLILGVDFTGARMSVRTGSTASTLFWSSNTGGEFEAGIGITDVFGNLEFENPSDFSFSLSNLTGLNPSFWAATSLVGHTGSNDLPDNEINIVPIPAGLAVGLVCAAQGLGLHLLRRRKAAEQPAATNPA